MHDDLVQKTRSRCLGAFVGLAIGDALGAPVEFKKRGTFEAVTSMRSGGFFDLPAGAWTDDTAMALCLADSLLNQPSFDAKDLLVYLLLILFFNCFISNIPHSCSSTG